MASPQGAVAAVVLAEAVQLSVLAVPSAWASMPPGDGTAAGGAGQPNGGGPDRPAVSSRPCRVAVTWVSFGVVRGVWAVGVATSVRLS